MLFLFHIIITFYNNLSKKTFVQISFKGTIERRTTKFYDTKSHYWAKQLNSGPADFLLNMMLKRKRKSKIHNKCINNCAGKMNKTRECNKKMEKASEVLQKVSQSEEGRVRGRSSRVFDGGARGGNKESFVFSTWSETQSLWLPLRSILLYVELSKYSPCTGLTVALVTRTRTHTHLPLSVKWNPWTKCSTRSQCAKRAWMCDQRHSLSLPGAPCPHEFSSLSGPAAHQPLWLSNFGEILHFTPIAATKGFKGHIKVIRPADYLCADQTPAQMFGLWVESRVKHLELQLGKVDEQNTWHGCWCWCVSRTWKAFSWNYCSLISENG